MRLISLVTIVSISAFSWLFVDYEGLAGEVASNVVVKHFPSLPSPIPAQEEHGRSLWIEGGNAPSWYMDGKYTVVSHLPPEISKLFGGVFWALFLLICRYFMPIAIIIFLLIKNRNRNCAK